MRKKMLQTPQSSCFQCLGWNVLKWVVRGSFQKKKRGKNFYHLSQICLPKTLGQKVVEKIERNGVPSKESLPPSFVKLINKIHKDVSHYWVFLWAGGRKKGRNNRLLTTSNLFSNCRFFLLLPQEGSVKPFIPKKKASQLGCVFNALSLNDSRKPAECFRCARRWPNCLFLGD